MKNLFSGEFVEPCCCKGFSEMILVSEFWNLIFSFLFWIFERIIYAVDIPKQTWIFFFQGQTKLSFRCLQTLDRIFASHGSKSKRPCTPILQDVEVCSLSNHSSLDESRIDAWSICPWQSYQTFLQAETNKDSNDTNRQAPQWLFLSNFRNFERIVLFLDQTQEHPAWNHQAKKSLNLSNLCLMDSV